MSTFHWFMLNLLLLFVAVFATLTVLQQEPGQRWAGMLERGAEDDAADDPDVAGSGAAQFRGMRRSGMLDADLLWQRTLFRPEREEKVITAGAEAKKADDKKTTSVQFELVGIMAIATEAVAIIQIRQTRVRSSTRGRRTPPKDGKQPGGLQNTRHVYRVGQEIEDTGYTLKEVRMHEDETEDEGVRGRRVGEAVVVKGDEERILRIERDDAGSVARVETARKQQEATRQLAQVRERKHREAAAKKATATPGKPPPPPPPPVAAAPGAGRRRATPSASASAASVATPRTLSRDERIRKALEARKRLKERFEQTQKAKEK